MRKLSAYPNEMDSELMPMVASFEVASYPILEKLRKTTKT